MGCVYLITNKLDGKKYVGCTKAASVARRWAQHRSDASKGKLLPLYNAMRKHGVASFTIEVLETVDGSHADLMAAEVRHIAAHGCLVPTGYNLTPGGDGVDLSVPGVRERQTDGCRRRSAEPKWLQHNMEAAARRVSDPAWRRAHAVGVARAAADPETRQRQREGAKRNAESAVWRAHNMAAMRRLQCDPVFRQALREGIARREADPAFHTRRAEGKRRWGEANRSKTCTTCSRELTVEERTWCKACRKEYHRLYDARRYQTRREARARLGPPRGKEGNEKVFGLYPYGCDICVERQPPMACGIPAGKTGCKSGSQYDPDVPCQYQGTVLGGSTSATVRLLP